MPIRSRRASPVRESLLCTLFIVASAASAQPPTPQVSSLQSYAVPRLQGLPSKAGPHIAQIQALGDDSWLNLGQPAADPVWGRARGRSWTPKMAYAADLRGAFLTGHGVHGFVKPDGHYQSDDLWFYDINANRWICAWPGTKNTWHLHWNSQYSFEEDSEGMPVPVGGAHGYEKMTYDSDLGKFVILEAGGDMYANMSLPLRKSWLPAGASGNLRNPFYYDVVTGKWGRPFTGFGPEQEQNSTPGVWAAEYIPTLKKVFFLKNRQVWYYDYASNTWTKAMATGSAPTGYDVTMCYDSKRNHIYIGHDTHFTLFDIKTSTWKELASAYVGSGVESTMTCDSANGIVLSNVYRPHSPQTPMMRVYDPKLNTWQDLHPMGNEFAPLNNILINAYYDPVLNVHVFHGAGDSGDNGAIEVYRYRRGDAPKEPSHSDKTKPLQP